MAALAQGELMQRNNIAAFPWAAMGLFGLILIISLTYGFQYLFPGTKLLTFFRLATLPFLLILVGLSWYGWRGWSPAPVPFSWPPLLGFLLMSLSFILTVFFQSGALSPIPWPAVAVGVVAVSGYCQFKWGTRGSTIAFLCCALVLYIFLIARVPHLEGANMLETIDDAAREFLSGNTPYRHFDTSGGYVAFGYLPGLWLPYLPFVQLGLDMRIFNIAALLLIIFLFERSLPVTTRADILSLTLYPFILSSPLALMVLHGHVWPYWLLLLVTTLFFMKGRNFAGAIFFGLSLASRQPALFLAGPLAAYMYRQTGLKSTLMYAAVAATAYLCLVLPFALWTGKEFWTYSYLALAKGGPADQPHLSAANFLGLWEWGQDALKYCQVLIVIATMAAILMRAKLDFVWFAFIGGVCYLWLVFFNSYAVRYVYFPGFFLIAIALSTRFATNLARVRQPV